MFRSMWRVNVLIMFLVAADGVILAQKLSAPTPAAVSQVSETSSPNTQNTPVLQQRHPRYQVMPSDIMSVSFPLSPELNQETVTVQPDGFININNIGSIYVQGQTVPEIISTLKKAYAGILHDPIIDVYLTNFQAPQFTVSGQVGKPGQYPLRADTTVTEAVAVAGGFLPAAKTQVFFFHRVSSDWIEVKKLNVKSILNGSNVHEDVHLQPGDMIFVPEKFISSFRKYVPYSTGIYFNPSAALF